MDEAPTSALAHSRCGIRSRVRLRAFGSHLRELVVHRASDMGLRKRLPPMALVAGPPATGRLASPDRQKLTGRPTNRSGWVLDQFHGRLFDEAASFSWPQYTPDMSAERHEMFSPWAAGYQAIIGLSRAVAKSGLEPELLELVKMRASQINGCAYCLDMHSKDARAAGESEQRLYALRAWRETPFFSDRERAALALTEAVTLVADTHVPQQVLEEVASYFSPNELGKLVYAVIEINSWNRLAVTTGAFKPGSYEPTQRDRAL